MKNLKTADTESTFYGYQVIFNAKEYVWIFVKKDCPMSFCPHFVCPDSVRNFRKNAIRCLSDKDKTDLSGLSVPLSADVWCAVTLFNFRDNFPSSFKLSNFGPNFPTSDRTFQLQTELSNFILFKFMSEIQT